MKKLLIKIRNFFSRMFVRKKPSTESPFLLTALDLAGQYVNKKEGRLNVKRRIK
jgi:hypothetical protein